MNDKREGAGRTGPAWRKSSIRILRVQAVRFTDFPRFSKEAAVPVPSDPEVASLRARIGRISQDPDSEGLRAELRAQLDTILTERSLREIAPTLTAEQKMRLVLALSEPAKRTVRSARRVRSAKKGADAA